MRNKEFEMKKFVCALGVPVNTKKPMLDGRIVGGNPADITSYPYQVWPLCCCSVWPYFEVLEQKRPPAFLLT